MRLVGAVVKVFLTWDAHASVSLALGLKINQIRKSSQSNLAWRRPYSNSFTAQFCGSDN